MTTLTTAYPEVDSSFGERLELPEADTGRGAAGGAIRCRLGTLVGLRRVAYDNHRGDLGECGGVCGGCGGLVDHDVTA